MKGSAIIVKHLKVRCIVYIISLMIITFISAGLTELTDFYWVGITLLYVAIFTILVDIGIAIEKIHIKKKYIIYASLWFLPVVVGTIVSLIFNIDEANTWPSWVGGNYVSIVFGVFFFDMAKAIKKTSWGFIRYFFYFWIFIIIVGAIIFNIAFFLTFWYTMHGCVNVPDVVSFRHYDQFDSGTRLNRG